MPRAGLSPEAVVEGAADLVDEVGYGELTMSAVAARFGVAVPSLYKHVGGFDDLQRRLAIHAVDELGERLASAVADEPVARTDGPAGDDEHRPPIDGPAGADDPDRHPRHLVAFRRMAVAYRDHARAHPGRYAATVRAPHPDDADHLAASERVLETVLDVLADYGLTGDDAIDAARMVRAGLHGFVTLEAAGGFGLPRDVERSFDRLVDGLDHALGAWD